MKRLVQLVVISLLAAVQLSAQDTRTSDEILELKRAVSQLQSRVATLETALATVQTQVGATVGFTKVGPNAYRFDGGEPGTATLHFRLASLTAHVDNDIIWRAGAYAALESGSSVRVKGGLTTTLESGNVMTVKGAGTTNLEAGGMMTVKGIQVSFNGGTRQALTVATQISCPADGGPAVVIPTQSTVLIP